MYTAAGHPEKAAEKIRVVVDSLYKTGPDGLSGNDDCGQMSAWLVWSALGMYPMNPASGNYVFGYPLVNSAVIQLPGGKTMTIKTKGNLVKDPKKKGYISKIIFNGKELPVKQLTHQQLLTGGELVYQLAN
jgi:putative alpha-1,2-mannosidase